MGAYLNRPVVEKEKEEGSGDKFSYACTTMQGWRASQEDAHNCVVDLHPEWHMFAVYDGHGGTEVSKFTSAKLPGFLKERKFWESEDIGECLQKAFVDFDDFIRAEDSMKLLKEIANEGKPRRTPGDDAQDEADRIDTIEESAIPITELLKQYGGGVGGGLGKNLLRAFLQNRGDDSDSDEDEEMDEAEGEEEEEAEEEDQEKKENKDDVDVEADIQKDAEKGDVEGEEEKKTKKVQKRCSKSPIQSEAKKSKSDESEDAKASSSSGQEKGAEVEDEESSDNDFVADEDAEDEDQSDEEMEGPDFGQLMLGGGGIEVPGEDSGTTACVVLVGNDKVIVANAGDSRAILCRAGKAIDLSVDHKPEDDVETKRIHAAGGTIEDGRVNGGLNLSRAFGDHAYKKNHALHLKDQMITAHPDIKIESLTPEDEFLVVACDGIWNSMESQQVADFVSKLLAEGKTCAEVCDALCDACLAESTEGDGTGCDNMTVICTNFKR
ncbi:hypothetical protein B9Z55_008413 [Caenorhabditis nigoni]|uniref:protein-serine/threonine phosphatase n=1 Tax=Caenorhabditis nigoni TaxID=1611254 RepID=A0A2G5UMV6_9PELO|nr:hypothetical protein B9Z55_008413 [Caenorhabditis nigoni]